MRGEAGIPGVGQSITWHRQALRQPLLPPMSPMLRTLPKSKTWARHRKLPRLAPIIATLKCSETVPLAAIPADVTGLPTLAVEAAADSSLEPPNTSWMLGMRAPASSGSFPVARACSKYWKERKHLFPQFLTANAPSPTGM